MHAGWFTEEDVEWEIDWGVVEMGIGEHESSFRCGFAYHGEGAAFAVTDGDECVELVCGDGEDVAFLGFVAPDLDGAHSWFVVGNVTEFESSAASAVIDEFGQSVGDAACADVMDEGDGVLAAESPATVDDLLAAALHFGVLALDAGEVEVFVA